ncbi:unnamed protein product [Alopecurus aequalis]
MAIGFSTKLAWIFALLLIMVMTIQVRAQPPPGFISIDCGWKNSSDYTDATLGLQYSSDAGFVEGGQNHEILPEFMADIGNDQQKTLRSFPDGKRNCYTLPSTMGRKYLVRAIFTYGNYDGLNKSLDGSLFLFGLHIGVNFWAAVNLSNSAPGDSTWREVLTVAPGNLSVCLVNFGFGVPFISSLELRPLLDAMYPFVNTSVSVSYFNRFRFGNITDYITRYPTDSYDRFWESYSATMGDEYVYPYISLNTSNDVKSLPGSDTFNVPLAILQNAMTFDAKFRAFTISVEMGLDRVTNKDAKSLQLLPIFHFAEINGSNPNRRFDIYSSGDDIMFSGFIPSLFQVDSMYKNGQFLQKGVAFFTLNKTAGSSLPPLINAWEVYSLVWMENLTTDSDDGMCILWRCFWKENSIDNEDYAMYEEETPLHIDIRRFTYAELKLITNNFQSIMGIGGFGIVYHGILENGDEVAVKLLMETSIAESKDFLPEVQTCLALVYDFMPGGNLQQLLRGGDINTLNWEQRLHIALDAAQGLEYLHELCTPSIVHRDVKTPNILLDKNMVGIISDFGLSRAFNDAHTHISTVAAGTLGYLDSEYHATFQLTVKTDIYSFGIVLLEIITGQPPVFMDSQTVHLPNWVRQKIAKGSINDVVDKRLLDKYNVSSLQSAVEIAMNCVENASIDRPTMTEVVSRLKVWLPAVSSEKKSISGTTRLDTEIPEQLQMMIASVSNEGSSFQSGYTGGLTEISMFSGR